MQAIEIKQPGGPEVLVPTQRPDPVPSAGELLIARHGVGRQPARRAAAQGPVPDAAGRVRPAGAGSGRHGGRRRAPKTWPRPG